MRYLSLILFFTGSMLHAQAQFNNSLFIPDNPFLEKDSSKLFLRVENMNMLKNNEYFGDFAKGYTLFGYIVKPRLVFYPSSNTRLEAGVHLLKYSGRNEFTEALPLFTFQYHVCKGVDLIMGTLQGNLYHRFIEPLYKFDRYMENNVENGAQVLVYTRFLESDTYLNWTRFIFPGDPFKEEFSFGTVNSIKILPENKPLTFNLRYQALIAHRGGQIDAADTSLQSLVNMAAGFELVYNFDKQLLRSAGTRNYYLSYSDISSRKALPYSMGNAVYTTIFMNTKWVDFLAGYWNGYRFYAPRGEPQFSSVSHIDLQYHEAERKLLTFKLAFHHEIYENINLVLRYGNYYDLKNSRFEFYYGMHIVFHRNFFFFFTNPNYRTFK
mgnify:CR=1 FL=1